MILVWRQDCKQYLILLTASQGEKRRRKRKKKKRIAPLLIKWMSSDAFVSALRLGMSMLPQCRARLACLHVVSSLTEWPLSLRALYNGNITDTLVHISYEDTNRVGLLWPSSKHIIEEQPGLARQATVDSTATDLYVSSVGSISSGFQGEIDSTSSSLSPRPRGKLDSSLNPSNNTAVRGQPEVPSSTGQALSYAGSSRKEPLEHAEPTPASDLLSLIIGLRPKPPTQDPQDADPQSSQFRVVRPSEEQVELEKKDPRAFTESNVREETMTVCLALANICQYSTEFAQRVYKMGYYPSC